MATEFSPNIYSGGAVVFDSSPSVRLQEQIINRQLAKNEALDKYFTGLNKSINPAGMRTQDTAGFVDKTKEMRDFYAKNREAIRNPRKDSGQAQSEYYSRYQDALNYINQSKNEAEKIKSISSVLVDPEKRSRVPDSVIEAIGSHDLPLTDPNRKSFNPSMLSFDPKPFGIKEQQDFLKGSQEGIKMTPKISIGGTDPNTLQQTITTTETFDDAAKATIGKRAFSAYNSDPSFKNFIDDIAKDDNAVASLNNSFKKDFGRDIETPEDVSVAWTLGNIQRERQQQKIQDNQLARQKLMEGIRFGHAKELAYLRNSLNKASQQEQNDVVDELYEGMVADAQNNPVTYRPAQGSAYKQYEMKAPAGVKSILAVTDANGKKIQPDVLRFSEDMKTVTPIFFERYYDEKGKRTDEIPMNPQTREAKVLQEFSKPISEAEFKQRWKKELLGVAGFNKSLKSKSTKTPTEQFTVSGKKYSRDQLNKMGYSDTEITDAIKAGLIQQ